MGLFGNLFGGGKKKSSGPEAFLNDLFSDLFEKADLDLSASIEELDDDKYQLFKADITGDDEALLTKKDGMLLDALQLFAKRSLQNRYQDEVININCDSNDYRSKESEYLEAMIEKLMNKAIDQGKAVYVKALSPKDRRVVHQFIAQDERVKSKSIGDGLYKKIKITPIN